MTTTAYPVNIYDQLLALPRHHRLAVARWILATNSVGYDERQRVMGRLPRIGRKRDQASKVKKITT